MSEIPKNYQKALDQLQLYLQKTQESQHDILGILQSDTNELVEVHTLWMELIEESIGLVTNITQILEEKQQQWAIQHSDNEHLIQKYKNIWEADYQSYIQDPHIQYQLEDEEAIRNEFYNIKLKELQASLDRQYYKEDRLIQKAKLDIDRLVEIGKFHLIAYRDLGSAYNKQHFETIYNLSSAAEDIEKMFSAHMSTYSTFFGWHGTSEKNAQIDAAFSKSMDMFYRVKYWWELRDTIAQQIDAGNYLEAVENIKKFHPSLVDMVDQQITLAEHQRQNNHSERKDNLKLAIEYMSIGHKDPSDVSLRFWDRSEDHIQQDEERNIQDNHLRWLEQLKHIRSLDKELGDACIQSIAVNLTLPSSEQVWGHYISILSRIAEFQYLSGDSTYSDTFVLIKQHLSNNDFNAEYYFTFIQYLYNCGGDRIVQVDKCRVKFESSQEFSDPPKALEQLWVFVEHSMLLYDVLEDLAERQQFLDDLIDFIDTSTGNIASYSIMNNVNDDTIINDMYVAVWDLDGKHTEFMSHTHFKIYKPIIKSLYILWNNALAQRLEMQTGISLELDQGMETFRDEHRYDIKPRKTYPEITRENFQQELHNFHQQLDFFKQNTSIEAAESAYLDLANYGFRLWIFLLKVNQQLFGDQYITFLETSTNDWDH